MISLVHANNKGNRSLDNDEMGEWFRESHSNNLDEEGP